jgi:hypothetical protein
VVDLDDRSVVDINDTLLDLLGYSRNELVSGRVPWATLTPPEWSEVDTREIGACLDVAMTLGYVESVDARLLDALDKVRATLVRVTV